MNLDRQYEPEKKKNGIERRYTPYMRCRYMNKKKKNGIKRIWIDTVTECEIVGFNNSRAA